MSVPKPTPHHRMLSHLEGEGRRNTTQRNGILEILENANGPLTADQICEQARHEVPYVGMSTVYRTLKILQAAQAVRVVVLPDGVTRYEKDGGSPHHFQCRTCGQIWTLRIGAISSLRGLRLVGGFTVEDHESTFHGQCSNCRASAT